MEFKEKLLAGNRLKITLDPETVTKFKNDESYTVKLLKDLNFIYSFDSFSQILLADNMGNIIYTKYENGFGFVVEKFYFKEMVG